MSKIEYSKPRVVPSGGGSKSKDRGGLPGLSGTAGKPPRKPFAVATADWHLQGKPPGVREEEGEENWLEVQKGYLDQVWDIANAHCVPVLHAGDVLDRWNSTPELINFCLDNMPEVWAVAGNHETPHHNRKDIKKSAYWTLVEARKVISLDNGTPLTLGADSRVRVWGFPYGAEPTPCPEPHDLYIEVCLCHKYLFTKNTGYHGAPDSGRVSKISSQFKGYDFVISGDNHTPFCVLKNDIRFVNPGCLYRRTSDHLDYRPAVWLLYGDGTAEPVHLDVSKDKFMKNFAQEEEVYLDPETARGLVRVLREVKEEGVDFDEAVRRVVREGRLKEGTVGAIREIMEG